MSHPWVALLSSMRPQPLTVAILFPWFSGLKVELGGKHAGATKLPKFNGDCNFKIATSESKSVFGTKKKLIFISNSRLELSTENWTIF